MGFRAPSRASHDAATARLVTAVNTEVRRLGGRELLSPRPVARVRALQPQNATDTLTPRAPELIPASQPAHHRAHWSTDNCPLCRSMRSWMSGGGLGARLRTRNALHLESLIHDRTKMFDR